VKIIEESNARKTAAEELLKMRCSVTIKQIGERRTGRRLKTRRTVRTRNPVPRMTVNFKYRCYKCKEIGQRPEVIYLYNKNMGGVDKLVFLLSLYRSYHRSKKWTVRMIAHATDLGLANSWLEYVQRARELGVPKKNILDLFEFRQSVAESLMFAKHTKRGRPRTEDTPSSTKKAKTESRPNIDMRYDGLHHWPEFDENKNTSRCKMEGCKNKCGIFCSKCKVHLCIIKKRNCFVKFHKKNKLINHILAHFVYSKI
jgi:hypothetical protein